MLKMILSFAALQLLWGQTNPSFETWLLYRENESAAHLLNNISPNGALPGTVVASRERFNPPYYFNWIRDAALTMGTVETLFERLPEFRAGHESAFYDYNYITRVHQVAPTLSGQGEPKFFVDGRGYDGGWCRPQNDGPALRAISLMRAADLLTANGKSNYVRRAMYDAKIPTNSTIKADLEFVAHHWREWNCDLWEEVKGDHFYTRMVQRKALLHGADFARRQGDPGAADFYLQQAKQVEAEILRHWDPARGYFVATLNQFDGVAKTSQMDASVILAILHGHTEDGFLDFLDSRVIQTVQVIIDRNRVLYPINQRAGVPGVAIGRYPEDSFAGHNPWFLTTAALAQFSAKAALRALEQGDRVKSQVFIRTTEDSLARIRYHEGADGAIDEQMNGETGYMTSAPDLTWSHAETLEAIWALQDYRTKLAASHSYSSCEAWLTPSLH